MRFPLIPALVIFWVSTGLLSAGWGNAAFRHEFKHFFQSKLAANSNTRHTLSAGLMGPVSLLAEYIVAGNNYGWNLEDRPFPCTETDQIDIEIWCKDNPPGAPKETTSEAD